MWALGASVSIYAAAYPALAEILGQPLVTTDARLGAVRGHSARVEVFTG